VSVIEAFWFKLDKLREDGEAGLQVLRGGWEGWGGWSRGWGGGEGVGAGWWKDEGMRRERQAWQV
jgi:hypothetical protein